MANGVSMWSTYDNALNISAHANALMDKAELPVSAHVWTDILETKLGGHVFTYESTDQISIHCRGQHHIWEKQAVFGCQDVMYHMAVGLA